MASNSGAGDAEEALSRLASGNSALQSLLRRLESGLEDLLPHSSGRAKMKELLTGLKEVGNEGRQMEALAELCEVLSMGQEDILLGFSVDSFLPVLVDLLKAEHNPEMMLLSSRAITHLLEVLPKTSPKVAASGAVEVFCQRLLTIEFIDVAEQSLLAMHKLSVEHPEVLQRAGGLAASLMFIDFFDMNTQRTAAATAANICRNVGADCLGMAADMTPNLSQLLSNADQRIVESACLALTRLVDSFANDDKALQTLLGQGTVERMVDLLSPADRQVGDGDGRGFNINVTTFTSIVKALATACRTSPVIAVQLLEAGGLAAVYKIISKGDEGRASGGSDIPSTVLVPSAMTVQRPLEQLLHTLTLANELLPPLKQLQELVVLVDTVSAGTQASQDLFGKQPSTGCLEAFAQDKAWMMVECGALLFPVFVDISVTIVNDAIRIKCLAAITKLVGSFKAQDLAGVVDKSPLLGYLAGYLASGIAPVVGLSLILIDMLLEKLPALAVRCAREGIVYETKRLCSREAVTPSQEFEALTQYASRVYQGRFGPGSAADAAAACDATLKRAQETASRLNKGEVEALIELRDSLTGPDALSSFQLVTSGLAEGVLNFLSSGEVGRVRAFVKVMSGSDCKASGGNDSPGNAEAMRALVCKLNEAISVRESFPVILSDPSGDLSAGLKLLAQPIKLRLARDPSETGVSDYSSNVVLIEPLATLNAVQDFLWSKVYQGPAGAAGSGPASDADGGCDGGSRSCGSQSGGEETVAIEEDEDNGDDGDDIDDEQDAPAADITRPTPSRPRAGRGGSDGAHQAGGLHTRAGQHLTFFANGRKLAYKAPIIQAIGLWAQGGRNGCALGSNAGSSKAAWDQVHTVTYRVSRPEDEHGTPSAGQGGAAGGVGGESSKERHEREGKGQVTAGFGETLEEQLHHMIASEVLLEDPSASSEMRLTLRLLRALSLVSRDWYLVADHGLEKHKIDRAPLIPAADLINVKLASKLMRQLQDPLMLCTGSLPRWCREVVEACPSLFPLETREFYTSVTAFGISRALHSMQRLQQGGADRSSGDVRIGRIQREKIRVSRGRILSSAMRALELYASHRSILEGCTSVRFVRCEEHKTLATRRGPDGAGMCHECDNVRSRGERREGGGVEEVCWECGASGCLVDEWWMLSDEEAHYVESAFPPRLDVIHHILLQCPHCKSVNFPGTEQALVVNRKGHMTSLSGKVMHEHDYRAVTRHVTASCSNVPLNKLPVRLSLVECSAVARLVGSTPEAEEGGEEGGEAWLDGVHEALISDSSLPRPPPRYVSSPYGLFPRPYPPNGVPGGVVECFRLLGRLIGKALLDQRHVDIPLSPAMLKWMVGQPLTWHDIALIDPQLFATLSKMRRIGEAYKRGDKGAALLLDGCSLDDLALDFTLPGYPDVQLVCGGRDMSVSADKACEYVELVTRMLLHDGIHQQLAALEAGFNEVFGMDQLSLLTGEELEGRMRGDVAAWDAESLRAAIKPDHGFKDSSPPIAWLISVMLAMDRKDRRLFMRFLTGSPTLPSGGLRRLNPPLTVVRKEAEAPLTPDDYLPSVMTCANYLKLPDYSSEAVLRKRLFTAMSEGQLSFLLS